MLVEKLINLRVLNQSNFKTFQQSTQLDFLKTRPTAQIRCGPLSSDGFLTLETKVQLLFLHTNSLIAESLCRPSLEASLRQDFIVL